MDLLDTKRYCIMKKRYVSPHFNVIEEEIVQHLLESSPTIPTGGEYNGETPIEGRGFSWGSSDVDDEY